MLHLFSKMALDLAVSTIRFLGAALASIQPLVEIGSVENTSTSCFLKKKIFKRRLKISSTSKKQLSRGGRFLKLFLQSVLDKSSSVKNDCAATNQFPHNAHRQVRTKHALNEKRKDLIVIFLCRPPKKISRLAMRWTDHVGGCARLQLARSGKLAQFYRVGRGTLLFLFYTRSQGYKCSSVEDRTLAGVSSAGRWEVAFCPLWQEGNFGWPPRDTCL